MSEQHTGLTEALGAWAAYANPGEEHTRLAPLVGVWDVAQRFRLTPDSPFHDVKGTAENRWVLGGRFVELSLAIEDPDEPFRATGYLGFDRIEGEYVFAWLETASTALETRRGPATPEGDGFMLLGAHRDPESRAVKQTRLTLRMNGADAYRIDIAELPEGEKPFVYFEAVYRRRNT